MIKSFSWYIESERLRTLIATKPAAKLKGQGCAFGPSAMEAAQMVPPRMGPALGGQLPSRGKGKGEREGRTDESSQ